MTKKQRKYAIVTRDDYTIYIEPVQKQAFLHIDIRKYNRTISRQIEEDAKIIENILWLTGLKAGFVCIPSNKPKIIKLARRFGFIRPTQYKDHIIMYRPIYEPLSVEV